MIAYFLCYRRIEQFLVFIFSSRPAWLRAGLCSLLGRWSASSRWPFRGFRNALCCVVLSVLLVQHLWLKSSSKKKKISSEGVRKRNGHLGSSATLSVNLFSLEGSSELVGFRETGSSSATSREHLVFVFFLSFASDHSSQSNSALPLI